MVKTLTLQVQPSEIKSTKIHLPVNQYIRYIIQKVLCQLYNYSKKNFYPCVFVDSSKKNGVNRNNFFHIGFNFSVEKSVINFKHFQVRQGPVPTLGFVRQGRRTYQWMGHDDFVASNGSGIAKSHSRTPGATTFPHWTTRSCLFLSLC